jgi:rhamnosyltransferase
MISIVIPVLNGGDDLRRCLDGIDAQRVDEPVEVVVVDSSSDDGSAELARSRGARVETIPRERFDHGATRNLGVSLAQGETVVFTSQDAYAADPDSLARLAAPLTDEGIAGAYGRQVPHHGARPPERYFLDFLYGERPRVQTAGASAAQTMDTTMFSNVWSAIPRRILERFPFADDMIMSEDQEWAARVLLAGFGLVYVPEAVVHHSHPYTMGAAFKRFFDSGASSDRAYMSGGARSRQVLRGAAGRYGRGELAWLWRTGQRRWIPYTVAYELAKFSGLQLGMRHKRLPLGLKRRLSAHPSFWDGQAGPPASRAAGSRAGP